MTELKNSIQSPSQQSIVDIREDVHIKKSSDVGVSPILDTNAPKEKTLIEVNYKTKNGKLVADEIYSDGSTREIKVNNGIVNYIMEGETSAPKEDICECGHDLKKHYDDSFVCFYRDTKLNYCECKKFKQKEEKK